MKNVEQHEPENRQRPQRSPVADDEPTERALGGVQIRRGRRLGLGNVGHQANLLCVVRPRHVFHELDQFMRRAHLGLRLFHRHAAPIDHDEPLGDVIDVVDVVSDENDRSARRAHLPNKVEDLGGFRQ